MRSKRHRFISALFKHLNLVLLAPSIFNGKRDEFSEDGSDHLCAEMPLSFLRVHKSLRFSTWKLNVCGLSYLYIYTLLGVCLFP